MIQTEIPELIEHEIDISVTKEFDILIKFPKLCITTSEEKEIQEIRKIYQNQLKFAETICQKIANILKIEPNNINFNNEESYSPPTDDDLHDYDEQITLKIESNTIAMETLHTLSL